MHAPATAPAKPSTGLSCMGTEFGGRAVGWPMAWAKAAQSGVETVRWVQPLVSSFSRTKFACTWRDRWVLYGCNSRGDATSGDRDGGARPWGALSLLVFLLQAPVSTIKGFPFLLMRYWLQAGCWECWAAPQSASPSLHIPSVFACTCVQSTVLSLPLPWGEVPSARQGQL